MGVDLSPILKEIEERFQEAVSEYYEEESQKFRKEILSYYDWERPENKYYIPRTHAMSDHATDEMSLAGTSANMRFYIDMNYEYPKHGKNWNTPRIIRHINAGGEHGKPNFWERAVQDIQTDLDAALESAGFTKV